MKLSKGQKQVKLGIQLYISREGGRKGSYVLVDGIFNSRYEAQCYQHRNFPNCPYKLKGLRVSAQPVAAGERKTA